MKFILINLQNLNRKVLSVKHKIDEENYISELLIPKNILIKLMEKPNIFNNIKLKLLEKNIEKKLECLIDFSNKQEWCFVLSDEILNNDKIKKYLTEKMMMLGGIKYIESREMENNLMKYISEYTNDKKIQVCESKLLLVYKNIQNININAINKYIKEYKKVNIYSLEKPTALILECLSKINKKEGSSIEFLKYSKKAFLEYSVVYFVDDERTNYPRMRLNKDALVLDELDSKKDKYNSNIIFFNYIKEKMKSKNELLKQYDLLSVATAVKNSVN